MRVLSLFAGIGGLDLGIEAAIPGAHVVAQVEIEPYCRGVLAKHWPDADRSVHDVRLAHRLYATPAGEVFTAGALPSVDLVCGGFPCQDLSTAGRGAGLDGERSGLWWQVYRLVRDLRPRYLVLENVAALVVRGLDVVLGALAELGYDAEWAVFSASDVGAPHRRRRVAIIAYLPDADGAEREQPQPVGRGGRAAVARVDGAAGSVADADARGREGLATRGAGTGLEPRGDADGRGAGSEDVADAGEARRDRHELPSGRGAAHAVSGVGPAGFRLRPWDGGPAEPRLGGAVDGLPARLDAAPWEAGVPRAAPSAPTTTPRLAACGNAVVPQWAYEVGLRVRRHMSR